MNQSKSSRIANTSRSHLQNTSRSSFILSESIPITKEITSLKRLLQEANSELSSLRSRHTNEVASLKSSISQLKQEVQSLRQEKQETMALQSYGIDEYGQLAQEVIRLRTEVDRLRYLYDKEKKKNLA